MLQAVERIATLTDQPFGMRLSVDATAAAWLRTAPEGLRWILLEPEADPSRLAQAVARIRASGRRPLVEATSRAEMARAVEAGAEGLIVAGSEAAGRSGSESSFVLLQAALAAVDLPVWVRGGVGPRVAGACVAAGAAGVVLEGALLLARESPLPPEVRQRIARCDGTESIEFRREDGTGLRVLAERGHPAIARLEAAVSESTDRLLDEAASLVGWNQDQDQAWPVGQDAAFAAMLAERHQTAGRIVQAIEHAIETGLAAAARARPLAFGSPLARSLGIGCPVLQGPMTRVSDVPAFAEAIADGGALPFLALAMLKGPALRDLLRETQARLGDRPWGVGLLGFVDADLRAEQVAAVREIRPPTALIAGGRPDQAAELDDLGITTFLHVPSPILLEQFLQAGARRFVLEGRECGGHVGPRSSFTLWEQAATVIERALDDGVEAETLQVVFAGGIHDARSASAVAALAGPLADRGVQVGVLAGTAYLFTKEAVETGAIVDGYQTQALRCERTVLLETGPGHLVRVSPSAFTEQFEADRRSLLASGKTPDEIREALERLNVGRLRLAAKGLERSEGVDSPLVHVGESHQQTRGLYMIGQVAALRDRTTTIAELHRDLCQSSTERIERLAPAASNPAVARDRKPPCDVAIIGMEAVFPAAENHVRFWNNTLEGVDAITEVPPDRWDWRPYYDPDPKAPDKVISKWGGFLPDIAIDPLTFGMPPSSLPSIEPAQLLALEVARRALADAGYDRLPFAKDRTAVVLGMGGGAAQLAMGYAFRSYLPMLDGVTTGQGAEALQRCGDLLPAWTEDSFPGFLLNVTAGRIANRLDLGGANYTVDAACGSSLAAALLAIRELRAGASDIVLLGGVDTVQNPFTYLAFSKTQAFSPRGRCRPFDASADGIVISEGVAFVVLKRLADAERDGDRILAVLKGVGSASDGRSRGLTAPGLDGQTRTLERAYEDARVSPTTVGYVEAHGTGTAVGDVVELEALSRVFESAGAGTHSCGLGSIKSMIGHTKCAAGLAGLINAVNALRHRVLPPTIGIERLNPNARLQDGPFHVSGQARPWLHPWSDRPRRAGVSAFGFGGTNFHAVLEAYQGNPTAERSAPSLDWPAELFLWRADSTNQLLEDVNTLRSALESGARPPLRAIARALADRFEAAEGAATLAIVAKSYENLIESLSLAGRSIGRGEERFDHPSGIHFARVARLAKGGLAFLFPGQGAQRVDMLRELALAFDEVRSGFEATDAALIAAGRAPIGQRIFPPSASEEVANANAAALTATETAQPAVGAASLGLLRLLNRLGIEPDLTAGHSYGELVALHAAGALEAADLAVLSEARGRAIREAVGADPGAMAAIAATPEQAAGLLDVASDRDLEFVNFNAPRQTVLAGSEAAIEQAIQAAQKRGWSARRLPVACAFHARRVASAAGPLEKLAREQIRSAPDRPVYSNLDAAPHPIEPASIAQRLGAHLASPVRFEAMIRAMKAQGASVFVEVGPGATLTSLVDAILEDEPHVAVALDPPGRSGLPGLLRALAQLAAAGVRLQPGRLFEGRSISNSSLADLLNCSHAETPSPSTWLVNGSRARRMGDPEPRRLGQAPELWETTETAAPPTPRAHAAPTASEPRRDALHKNEQQKEYQNHSIETNSESKNDRLVDHFSSRPFETDPGFEAGAPDADPVILEFQETMRRFLEVQKATMLSYLNAPEDAAETRRPRNGAPRPPTPSGNGTSDVKDEPTLPSSIHERLNAHWDERERTEIESPSPEHTGPALQPEPNPEQGTIANPSDPQSLAATLIGIVSERTGYPADMLQLDLDMEADLGIDSIKRVEILGKLRDSLPDLAARSDSKLMDALARARTLGAIVERIGAAQTPASEATVSPVSMSDASTSPSRTEPRQPQAIQEPRSDPEAIRRFRLEAVEAPSATGLEGLSSGGVVLVVDDGRGIADHLARRLADNGLRVCVVDRDQPIDWTSTDAIERALDAARQRGPLVGIVHLAGLSQSRIPNDWNLHVWKSWIDRDVKGLFLLVRAAAADLQRAAGQGGVSLIAATGLGGGFAGHGIDPTPSGFFPGQGGIAGLLKTIAREWPEWRTRVLDFDPTEAPEWIGDHIYEELFRNDGWPEIGYHQGRRMRLQPVEASLAARDDSLELAPGVPVVITGGARGITAAVAIALAKHWRPTLLLLGSGPAPEAVEDPETAGIDDPAELKARIRDRLACSNGEAGPSEIERRYRALRRSREMTAHLQSMSAAGATVDYQQADVRDPEALARALDRWRRRFGEPVGVIHGAGLIQDKWLKDKTPESFDRVLGTKVEGALNLARLLRPESLQFAAFFSSIAGRFGNPGQSDYAAANEILNKFALWLDQRWPCRVLSVIWGPWSSVGMVSELEQHLLRRGLGMIPPEAGPDWFLNELRYGSKGEVEVLIAGALGTLAEPLQQPRSHTSLSEAGAHG